MSRPAPQTVFGAAAVIAVIAVIWAFWPGGGGRPSAPAAPLLSVATVPVPPSRRIPTDAEIRAAHDQEACRRKLAQRGQVVLYISPSKQVRSAVCHGVDWFAEAGRMPS